MNKELLDETVALWVSRDVRMKAKIKAATKGLTMKEYVEGLILKDLKNSKK